MKTKNMRDLEKHWAEQQKKAAKKAAARKEQPSTAQGTGKSAEKP